MLEDINFPEFDLDCFSFEHAEFFGVTFLHDISSQKVNFDYAKFHDYATFENSNFWHMATFEQTLFKVEGSCAPDGMKLVKSTEHEGWFELAAI